MKKIISFSFVCALLFIGFGISFHSSTSATEIRCVNEECDTFLSTDDEGWLLSIICEDGVEHVWTGTGEGWSGTLCGVSIN
ncbi:MAG: hypothetical protein F4Z62_07925 [Rhodothermaceae bacterium]|nr:hypothetical protein [Rhodothermaceae bacterium]MXW33018.1 hypothetical protein [Rhodothermaceae bacterium]MYE63197.1 hypothetical protein [Rhodothermaceae bacterium]